MWNAIEWTDGCVDVIDQTLLPGEVRRLQLRTVDDVVDAIERLAVRGAPAIGVCAAYGMAIGIAAGEEPGSVAGRLVSSRPTAVNLEAAVRRVLGAIGSAGDRAERALAEAHAIFDEDRASCDAIGKHGREELGDVRRVLTHCNTGRLATAGIGTALGVVYAKAAAGEEIAVVATETRPLRQGARLTAWELADAGIGVTLVADTAAGAVLAGGRVDAVIVGCDRVARNGDTANKIGTYNLAVLAQAHGVPFYVAGPLSSFDPDAGDGSAITIEERGPLELVPGGLPASVVVWNPAFDITPGGLITAFITDEGVLRPPFHDPIGAVLAR